VSDLQPSAGYATIEDEFEAALRRAFAQQPEPTFIYVDSRRQRFLGEGIAYGERRGWLIGTLNEIEEQYSRYEARLTDAGRAHFGLPPKPTGADAHS
jgi:hypothetical protein